MSGHGFQKIEGMRYSINSPFFASTWMPEGLVLTPRTASAPYGYGFPKRNASTGVLINPPYGTVLSEQNEALNQVLLNRFENNKYLDKIEFVAAISEDVFKSIKIPEVNDRLRNSLSTKLLHKPYTVVYWPLFYEPSDNFWDLTENRIYWTDVPGSNRWSGGYNFFTAPKPTVDENGLLAGSLPNRQINDAYESLIYEEESDQWFCHWAEELLYDNDSAEAIFQETNRYRSEVGRKPLIREIRGFANPARMILSEMQRAQVQYHNDEERFRKGYGLVADRVLNGAINFILGGENLITSSSTLNGFSWAVGQEAALGWRNSPLHYANMVAVNWDSPEGATSIDIFGNVAVTISERGSTAGEGSPLDNVYDPPFAGRSWAQLFVKRDRWLYAGNVEHRTQYGTVTTGSFFSPIGMPIGQQNTLSGLAEKGYSYLIFYKGRIIFVEYIYEIENQINSACLNLGAGIFMENGELHFRVIFAYYDEEGIYVTSCRRPVHGEHLDWVGEGILNIPTIYTQECFTFSSDGTIAIGTFVDFAKDYAYQWYFTDLPSSATPTGPVGKRIVYCTNGVFSLGDLIIGPNITYTMTVHNESKGYYNYKQEGSGSINLVPFFNSDGTLSYIQYEMNHFVNQFWTGAETYETIFNVNDTIVFNSGKRLQIKKINFSGEGLAGGAVTYFTPIDDLYFITFFYFNPVTEDIVYARHNVTIDAGTQIQTDVYVNDTLIKSYPSQAATSNYHIIARPVILSVGVDGNYGSGILCTHNFLNRLWGDEYGSRPDLVLPYWFQDIYNSYTCGISSSEKAVIGKVKIGTYPASIPVYNAWDKFCLRDSVGSLYFEGGYKIGIPYVSRYPVQEGLCYFARYKDRILTQIYINGMWKVNSTTTSFEDRNMIYANFPLNEEVGIGNITEIIPFGVIHD